jgi:hypothetical protein
MIAAPLLAQPPANCSGTKNKMLIAGDSWAQYIADDSVYNTVFKMYGHADKKTIAQTYEVVISLWGDSGSPDPWDYAVSGSEAREWADEANYPYLQNVRNALNANPDVNIVLLSIGGNDILAARCDGGWYENMDLNGAGNEAALLNTIMANTQYIVDEILAVRPNIKVIISGYDYPNFNVQGAWAGCAWLCNLCDMYACERRKQLSYSATTSPPSSQATCEGITPANLITDQGINQMMQTIEQQRQAFADSNPRVLYDNSIGLMHHYYGDGTSSPGVLPHPQAVSPYAPGGNVAKPSLRENFRLVNIESWFDAPADPIHLTQEGYTYKAKNVMDNLLFNQQLRGQPIATFFSEGGNNDGYVETLGGSPEGTSTTGIRVGDNGNDFWGDTYEYYGILSFNTANLPDDATIQGGSIYIIRSSEDDNPFFHTDRSPRLDIKSGNFGTTAAVQTSDWNASASATNIGCFNGKADENKYAVRIDLKPAALPFVNKTGRTQFRMYFNYADWSPEYINFYDGDQTGALQAPSEEEQRIAAGENQIYSEFTVRKSPNGKGTFDETILERSKPITKEKGLIYEKVLIGAKTEEDGTKTEYYRMMAALEHEGLAKLMGSKAPFIDIWYSMPVPNTPTALAATATSTSSIDVTWADNATNETAYELQVSLSPTGPFTTIATLPANTTSYTDTGLAEGTTYYYQVAAINAPTYSAWSNIGAATTLTTPLSICPDTLWVNAVVSPIDTTYLANMVIISDATISNGDTVVFTAGNEIILQAGFQAANGSEFLANIQVSPCPPSVIANNNPSAKFGEAAQPATRPNSLQVQVMPNPMTSTALVRYFAPSDGPINLTVFDTNGRKIAALPQGSQQSGWQEASINAASWAKGVYFLNVRTNKEVAVIKIVVLQ